jgi:hypothetical protein
MRMAWCVLVCALALCCTGRRGARTATSDDLAQALNGRISVEWGGYYPLSIELPGGWRWDYLERVSEKWMFLTVCSPQDRFAVLLNDDEVIEYVKIGPNSKTAAWCKTPNGESVLGLVRRDCWGRYEAAHRAWRQSEKGLFETFEPVVCFCSGPNPDRRHNRPETRCEEGPPLWLGFARAEKPGPIRLL